MCVTSSGSSDWAVCQAQSFINIPDFPQSQVLVPVFALTNLELINTLLSTTFKAAGTEKMSQTFLNNDHSIIIANIFNRTSPYDESKILAWLSPLEPLTRHREIGAQRVDSVGSRLLESNEFRHWHDGSRDGSNHATLFCHGNPGVGKSYIR